MNLPLIFLQAPIAAEDLHEARNMLRRQELEILQTEGLRMGFNEGEWGGG